LVACQLEYVGEVFCSIGDDDALAVVADLLGHGLDPATVTLYRRRDVPELLRLAQLLADALELPGTSGPVVAGAGILALQATDVLVLDGAGTDLPEAIRLAEAWNERFPAEPLAVPRACRLFPAPGRDGAEEAVVRRAAWSARPDEVEEVLRFGAHRVRREAAATLDSLRETRARPAPRLRSPEAAPQADSRALPRPR
jgi:hypothetical protein